MKNYTLKSLTIFIDKYVNEFNGNCEVIQEGTLGLGTILLHGAIGRKNVIIREYFINEWASGHDVKFYKKIPKKYLKFIN